MDGTNAMRTQKSAQNPKMAKTGCFIPINFPNCTYIIKRNKEKPSARNYPAIWKVRIGIPATPFWISPLSTANSGRIERGLVAMGCVVDVRYRGISPY